MIMASHRTIDLELRKDKPDNVYRFIEDWESVPSAHADGQGIHYLFLAGIFPGRARRAREKQGDGVDGAAHCQTNARLNVLSSQPSNGPGLGGQVNVSTSLSA